MDEKQLKYLPTLGTLIGGSIAFLLRPEAPQIGQLPFGVVATRGTELTSVDEMLIPIAEASFNYMIAGAIIGAIIGMAIFWTMSKK
ncbi:hypothetical protein ACT9XH_06275 [Methanococcoides methylutens]|uniref:hypothetical protein n=1 Tax=Methanococcoides methylutens TaxID=2226 RepID=UPI0040444E50